MRILTFDLEEWFHLLDHPGTESEGSWSKLEARFESNLHRILSFLDDCAVPATFFCLGWIAEKYPDLVRKISEQGYEIACHSNLHQLAFRQSPQEFRSDFIAARNAIADATGVSVDTYRIPGFSLNDESLWVLDILSELEVKVDCSVFPANRFHGGLPDFSYDRPCTIMTKSGATIKEFPLNTRTVLGNKIVFSGGGYFRLIPFWLLQRWFLEEEYVMTYFHPRDFDPDQPVLPGLSLSKRFRSYVGLRQAESKLVRLLKQMEFVDVRTASMNINWEKVPLVRIHQGL